MAKTGVFWGTNPINFGQAVKAEVYKMTRKTAQTLFDTVVDLSPVDSGAYRASWHVSEGSPEYKWVGRQKTRGWDGDVLDEPSLPKLSTKFYRRFYVTNGAPYALRLEYGWSDQAPLGVVRQALSMMR